MIVRIFPSVFSLHSREYLILHQVAVGVHLKRGRTRGVMDPSPTPWARVLVPAGSDLIRDGFAAAEKSLPDLRNGIGDVVTKRI